MGVLHLYFLFSKYFFESNSSKSVFCFECSVGQEVYTNENIFLLKMSAKLSKAHGLLIVNASGAQNFHLSTIADFFERTKALSVPYLNPVVCVSKAFFVSDKNS